MHKHRLIGALLGAVLATPVAAQDFSVDDHLIDRCIAVHDNPMICVGREAEECVLRNGGGPNMVLTACFEAETAVWDDGLNEAYRHLVTLAKDREGWDVGYEEGVLVDALRDMQRAWIDYRDASCDNAAALTAPFGSAAGPAITKCLMFHTARQYFVLRGLRQDYLR